MAKKAGVTVKDIYWTLGSRDIVALAPDDLGAEGTQGEFFLPDWQIPMAAGGCRGRVSAGEEVWRAVLRL